MGSVIMKKLRNIFFLTLFTYICLYSQNSYHPQTQELAIHYYCLGMQYYDSSDFQNAIDQFTLSVQANPMFETAYINRALSWYYLRNIDFAIDDLSILIALNGEYLADA